MARLKERYENEVVGQLVEEFKYPNRMAVPAVGKVSINVGVGEAIQNVRLLDLVSADLAAITGQWPVITRARKSIAQFKLREGMPIGVRVTLRGVRAYEFLDRLMNIGLPRVRDFRGVSPKSFDGRGNYTLGIKEHAIFPEVDLGRTERIYGMNITITTSAGTDEEARFLLEKMGMPFRKTEPRRVEVA